MATPLRQSQCRSEASDMRTGPRSGSRLGTSVPATKIDLKRTVNTQPTYDFLTGAPTSPPPAGRASRQSQALKADVGNEDLRAQIKSLQYEVDSLKQEREFKALRQEKELRDAQAKAEADFKRAQASENNKHVTSHKYEALEKELKELQTQSANRQHDLEKRLRASQEETRSLREDVAEAYTEAASIDRQHKYQLQEIETKNATLQKNLSELRQDLDQKVSALQVAEAKLSRRENYIAQVEGELQELKAQAGDVDELETIRTEMSEQMGHMRLLEKSNREQMVELRHLRQVHKAVEIVEEEKRTLENKVRAMNGLQRELVEAQFQRKILEDEREAWASFLREAAVPGEPDFDSPEALARAYSDARLQNASLLEQLGLVKPEISEKEAIITLLEIERKKLHDELTKLRLSGGGGDSRVKARLERQRTLAFKEVEYLRAQLKTFESEDVTGEVRTDVEERSRKRIEELETLVEQYRGEVQKLHDVIPEHGDSVAKPDIQSLKRPHEEDPDERLGELSRKNRKLQTDCISLQQLNSKVQSELLAVRSQLSSLQSTARTRVLTLRSNPTDDFENYKFSTITSLREENKALLAQVTGEPNNSKVVPISTFNNAKLEIAELEKTLKDKEKFILRLKQIFSVKSLEYREAVVLLLGWEMEIMANGHFRMTSTYNPGSTGGDGAGGNYLVFDGEKGNMKIGGGPQSDFAQEIKPLIKFWVEERNEVPLFLAAATMEFYEKTTRARKIM